MLSPLAFAYYKSGQLEKSREQYEQQADTAKAVKHYQKFLSSGRTQIRGELNWKMRGRGFRR